MNRLETKASLTAQPTGEIAGLAWVFGLPDDVGDVIEKGAIGNVTGLPMFYQHQPSQRIGTWVSAEETDLGLIVKGTLNITTSALARRIHGLVKAGKLSGLSIGFDRPSPNEFKTRPGGGRVFSKINLAEISVVSAPSHGSARILETKSAKEVLNVDDQNIDVNDDTSTADFSALETKMAAHDGELSTIKASLDKIEARLSRPGIGASPKAEETKAAAEQKAFATYFRKGENALSADEIKALNVTTAAQGGYIVPPEMSDEILRELVEYSPIRALSDVRQTTKSSVLYPKRTGRPNITWLDEGEARTEEAIAFGQVEIKIKEAGFYIPLTNRLLSDSQGAAETEVRLSIAEAFGRNESEVFLIGDGVKEPSGILTDAALVTVDAPMTAPDSIQYDSVLDLFYGLPATYRNRGSWLLNSSALKLLRKLKDEAGNFIWMPAVSENSPQTIFGRPVIEIPEMPEIAEDAVPVLFGDFKSAYRVVDHVENGSAFSVLVDPYTASGNGITKFHANRRVGARLIKPEAIVGMKMTA